MQNNFPHNAVTDLAIGRLVVSCTEWENVLHYCLFKPAPEAVLTITHNLCFGAKIRKIGIPQFFSI